MPLSISDVLPELSKKHRIEDVKRKLAKAAKTIATLKRDALDGLKDRDSRTLRQGNFLWNRIISGFATMGGASGWKGLVGTAENYQRVTYDAIHRLPSGKRLSHVVKVCKDAKVRYSNRKAEFIVGCYDHVQSHGGPAAAERKLLSQSGRDAKISFLMEFPGIGEKHARNLMMGVCHPEFMDSIAVDSRLKGISAAWGVEFESYDDYETFYLSVAKGAGLSGWELDRLMFWCQGVFLPPICD